MILRPRLKPHAASQLVCLCVASGLVSVVIAQESTHSVREILHLDGWDEAAWSEFEQGESLSADEISGLLPLLRRLRLLDDASVERWTSEAARLDDLVSRGDQRAHLLALVGRLRMLRSHAFNQDDAERFGFERYHLCEVTLDEKTTAIVLTADVPRALENAEPLDEPVSFAGLFVKRGPEENNVSQLVFVAPRLAWHPVRVSGANRSFGWAVLGSLGFDVGLLDVIEHRSRLGPRERETFYRMLAASGSISPERLAHHAHQDLSRSAAEWEPLAGQASARQLLARTVLERAAEGHYSVAPLFNEPERQLGNLVVLEGVARRAVRIEIARAAGGAPSDVFERFGVDHYYELDIFTEDSQNHPVVFCVRRLPASFPTGAKIHEPVRVAGFFFKSWLHSTRRGADDQPSSQQQYAPLLVGSGPLWLATQDQPASTLPSLVGGVLFVAALAGIWGLVWWHRRGDRIFHTRTIRAQYTLPEGKSLDDIIADWVEPPVGWSAPPPGTDDPRPLA